MDSRFLDTGKEDLLQITFLPSSNQKVQGREIVHSWTRTWPFLDFLYLLKIAWGIQCANEWWQVKMAPKDVKGKATASESEHEHGGTPDYSTDEVCYLSISSYTGRHGDGVCP